MKGKVCTLAMLVVWAAAGLLAQGDRGLITGTVKDATGAVVPGAQVTANHRATNTNYKANTTATGDFTVPALPVGTYQVRVESTGFKTHIANDIVVAAGATARLDVTLELGTTQQTIEVTSAIQVVQSETARVSTEVSSKLVNELPIIVGGAVRSPFDLATITPEVAGGGDSSLRIAGGRVGAYGVTLDGTAATVGRSDAQVSWSVTNAPSVEALTEFSVESGGFKAETGHASGGTISFVSKSGTNDLHGNAYEFLRNQVLDARGFFAATKAIYKQNDFGATVGGPVWIPKLYNGKNRTFFFFSYEGFRNRVGASATPYTVPPPEFFQGDMHNWVNSAGRMIQIHDPTTTTLVGSTYQRTPFPNNQIPVSKFDPVSKAILAYAQPLVQMTVNAAPGTYAYVRNNAVSFGTTQLPNNKFSIKGDQVLTSKQRIAFLFGRTRQLDQGCGNTTCTLPIPLSGNPGYQRSDIYRLSYDHTISPTWLNRFYAGGNNWRQNHGSYTTFKGAPQSDGIPTQSTGWKEKGICVPNFPDCNMAFPIIAFQNTTTTWGVGAPNGSDNIVVEFRDDMTKVYGSHTFKWGYYYNNTHYNGFGLTYIAGQHNFSYLSTAAPLDTSQQTGSDFASFLLGQVSGYRLDTNRYVAGMYRTHQMYFQDDWRLTPRLTVNLGLRYEINLAPIYGQDMISNFDPSVPNPGADGRLGALIFGGSGPGRTGTRALAPNWYKGVGPRLGFAYTLGSKTTLRAAATRSYGPVINPMGSTHYSGFVQQITNTTDTSQGLIPMYTLSGGAPYWAPVPMIDPSVANGTNIPYYNGATATRSSGELTYAFNVQRQVAQNTVAEIGYLATLAGNIQSTLLAFNQLDYRNLPANLNPFTAAGRTLLTSRIDSAAAVAAGIKMPFAAFTRLWGGSATVGQSLRPYPQYSLIDTITGGGDRLGHSTYHSMQVKVSRRYSTDLTLQASYVLSKLLTDADSYSSTPTSMDATNRRLEKSIGAFDQTHILKFSYVYDLPFGAGKKLLNQKGVVSAVVGGWRLAGIHSYVSGSPMSLGTTISFPVYNGANRTTVPTYVGWRAPIKGDKFDPFVDSFLQPVSYFGTQPTDRFGNATRYNPKQRGWPGFNENFSLARTIKFTEPARLDIRFETFNLLNRTAFGGLSGGASLQNNNWGLWRNQSNTQRRVQVSLKLYW